MKNYGKLIRLNKKTVKILITNMLAFLLKKQMIKTISVLKEVKIIIRNTELTKHQVTIIKLHNH